MVTMSSGNRFFSSDLSRIRGTFQWLKARVVHLKAHEPNKYAKHKCALILQVVVSV